jgi:hypothetical protein
MNRFYLLFLIILVTSCARPLSWDVPTNNTGPFSYGPPTNVAFNVTSSEAGAKPAHTLQFDIKTGDLETYQAIVTYPDQFVFNGFLALGPVGAQVGSYAVDFDFDSIIDFTIPVYSLSNTKAYGDRDVNGSYSPTLDSNLTYTNPPAGTHVFTTILPNGGDGDPNTVTGPFTERLTATMNAGILTNPVIPGTYVATGDFTSVDPDNDGVDDSVGDPPQVLNVSRGISIIASDSTMSTSNTATYLLLLTE